MFRALFVMLVLLILILGIAPAIPAEGLAAASTRTPNATKTQAALDRLATRTQRNLNLAATKTQAAVNKLATKTTRDADVQLCGTARLCTQMSSCEQAKACLRLGRRALDRDRDGIPCENICGG